MTTDTDATALRTRLEAIVKELRKRPLLLVAAFRPPDSLRKRRLRPLP
jgi:hypothetical protein